MTLFLDTSVLVPAFLIDHQHHTASRSLLRRCNPEIAICASHSLAEFYSTLTRLPAPNRASPQQTQRFIENITQQLGFIYLNSEEYRIALRQAAGMGIEGGILYDYLLACCALKAGADIIYTWNLKHFQRFGPEVLEKLQSPQIAP